jgi:hypothetical protein
VIIFVCSKGFSLFVLCCLFVGFGYLFVNNQIIPTQIIPNLTNKAKALTTNHNQQLTTNKSCLIKGIGGTAVE